ncbi:MAG: transport system ATP-binding/permease protein [Streptomyces sp.]|nr:transport system ATP-binding/permease protein [Streptomyces sp.]
MGDREGKLHGQIAEHATDFAKVASLDAELRALREEREELEMRWLELAEDA